MEITARMRAVLDFVENVDTAADVGCDHGFVSAAMIREGRAKRVIACDISAKSLRKTQELIRICGLEGIDTVVSDGLHALAGEALDCVVIAGMGGLLMRDILADGLALIKGKRDLVLAPQGNEYELRVFLYENGYHICDEAVVRDDGHYYQIILAQQGKAQPPGEVYLHFGYYPVQRKDVTQKAFLLHKLREYERIVTRAQNGKNTEMYVTKKREMCQRIREVLECL